MMMAMVTMLVLSILAAEMVYQNQVYSSVVFRQRDQLRAELLARSALRMGLLQLKAAEKAKGQAKNMGLGAAADSLTDQIWQTPLVLPPPPLPDLGPSETAALEAFTKSLGLNGTLSVSISGEADRLNLNQLVWISAEQAQASAGAQGGVAAPTTPPAPGAPPAAPAVPLDPTQKREILAKTRKSFTEILDQLLEKKRLEDDAFRERYATTQAGPLIANLVAWMDPDTREDGDNREKNDYYRQLDPPYGIKNAPLTSESELYMVKGFDDTLTKLVTDSFSTQVTQGININKISSLFLQALIPELSKDNADTVIKRREDVALGGPYKSEEDFWTYLQSIGEFGEAKKRLAEQGIKLVSKETSYRVVVSTSSGSAQKTWVAAVGPEIPKVDTEVTPVTTPQAPAPPADISAPADEAAKTADATKPAKNDDSNSLRIIYLRAE